MVWNVSPIAFEFAGVSVHWYGLLFASAFLVAYQCFVYLARRDGIQAKDFRAILLCIAASTTVGGRLGHCVFYHWSELIANPLLVFEIRQGGNSSHGAVVGAVICMSGFALWKHWSILWLFDRMCVAIPLVAAFVRIGNFFNSEIVGTPTLARWGVIFVRYDPIVRHPVVLYEAAAYLLLFGLLLNLQRGQLKERRGFLFGAFLTGLFGARILLEYLKETPFISDAIPLTMGQVLSTPCVLVGALLMVRSLWFVRTHYSPEPSTNLATCD